MLLFYNKLYILSVKGWKSSYTGNMFVKDFIISYLITVTNKQKITEVEIQLKNNR